MKDQPTPAEVESPRNCTNCAFAIMVPLPPPHLGRLRECRRNPPNVVIMPSPQGAMITTRAPNPPDDFCCHEHRLREEIDNMPPRLTNG